MHSPHNSVPSQATSQYCFGCREQRGRRLSALRSLLLLPLKMLLVRADFATNLHALTKSPEANSSDGTLDNIMLPLATSIEQLRAPRKRRQCTADKAFPTPWWNAARCWPRFGPGAAAEFGPTPRLEATPAFLHLEIGSQIWSFPLPMFSIYGVNGVLHTTLEEAAIRAQTATDSALHKGILLSEPLRRATSPGSLLCRL